MSEHDEPKTALTPIEALLSWGVGRDTGGVDRLIPAEDLRRALEEARALLAEGYTTSPAPEPTETVEWEWSVTDTTSVELGIWPEERHTHPTRERAENEFVRDGDDVLLRRRPAGPWVPVDRGADGHEEGP